MGACVCGMRPGDAQHQLLTACLSVQLGATMLHSNLAQQTPAQSSHIKHAGTCGT